MGWYGYAQSNADQSSTIRLALASAADGTDAANLVAKATIEPNQDELSDEPSIQAGDILAISVPNSLIEEPIHGLFRVEPSGRVALGASYGRVSIGGLNVEEAEKAISDFLGKLLANPQVSVTLDHLPGDAKGQSWQRRGKLQSGESLRLRVGNARDFETVIDDVVQIDSTGKLAIPGLFTRIPAASRGLESLEEEIESMFAQKLAGAEILITRVRADRAAQDTSKIETRLAEIERLLAEVNRKLK